MVEIIGKEALLRMQLLPEKVRGQTPAHRIIHHIDTTDHAVLYFIFSRIDILQTNSIQINLFQDNIYQFLTIYLFYCKNSNFYLSGKNI